MDTDGNSLTEGREGNEERRKDRDSLHEATEATEERDEPEQDGGNFSAPAAADHAEWEFYIRSRNQEPKRPRRLPGTFSPGGFGEKWGQKDHRGGAGKKSHFFGGVLIWWNGLLTLSPLITVTYR
jgi:hypothetical protein